MSPESIPSVPFFSNPKTTIAGYAGYAAVLTQGVGALLAYAGKAQLGATVTAIGITLGQLASSAGNVHAQDGGR